VSKEQGQDQLRPLLRLRLLPLLLLLPLPLHLLLLLPLLLHCQFPAFPTLAHLNP
jgi:hypothetical protein